MNAQPIHLTEWNRTRTSDPVVVMVHGSAQGSDIGGDRHFSAQSHLSMRGWRVLVPDRPGHGRSPSPGRPDNPSIDGQWVAALIADGGHLVGHSFGGCVALAAAAQRPSAVISLTLIEPALQSLATADPHVQAWLKAISEAYAAATSPADLAIRFSTIAGIPKGLLGRGSVEATPEEIAAEMDRLGHGLMQLQLPTEAEIRENLDIVKQAGIPLLTVSGGWNPGIDAVARAAAELGGGQHVIIKSEHHFPHLASDEFNTALDQFMRAAARNSYAS